MKVVLLGYMASGKSVVGRKLADQLSYEFIDLDDYIEFKEKKSITELFEEKGEIYFRKKETEYLSELLLQKENFILSLGGGTPCYGNNIEIIKENSISFYLKTSLNSLYLRLLEEKSNRPLIASIKPLQLKEFIAKHLFERTIFYQEATYTISTDEKSIEQVIDNIKEQLI